MHLYFSWIPWEQIFRQELSASNWWKKPLTTSLIITKLGKVVLVLYIRYSDLFSDTLFHPKENISCPRILISFIRMQGHLPDGTVIAVKQLSSMSRQGNREFLNEIGLISCLQHPNLVKLYGSCIEGDQLLLVYEYMENNNLARALFGESSLDLKYINISWIDHDENFI